MVLPDDASKCVTEIVNMPFPGSSFAGPKLDLAAYCAQFTQGCPESPVEVLPGYVCGPESGHPPLLQEREPSVFRAIGCGFEFIYDKKR